MRFGAEIVNNGVRFGLWAPTARDIHLVVDDVRHAMPEGEAGFRSLVVPEARAGSRYFYDIGGVEVPDPASRFQPQDVFKPSMVVDPDAYSWRVTDWRGRPWAETVFYELHVGTFTPQGTYAAAADHLAELVELGVTAIELMPIADFPGARNWGYDGVLPFAPDNAYGTPQDLKRFIDRAHELGLMVFLDVVYNHFGPAGNYLALYARTFFTDRHQTPWGAAINFDGVEDGPFVREFFVENALYWLDEYRFDGLRLDAVHAIRDDGEHRFLTQVAETVRARIKGRQIHLVLENEANEAHWLERDAHGRPCLYSAQWQDDLHNAWHVVLTGEREGYYEDFADHPVAHLARALAEGFAYQGEATVRDGHGRGEPSAHLPPTAFVSFLQNHDQVGNRAIGERLHEIADPPALHLARGVLLLSPQIPLIFMGEDWQASTPFQFFVDFEDEPELAEAVREGRRREFSHFEGFRGGVPDPGAAETRARSILDWDERRRPPHSEAVEEMRALLALRHREIVPLITTPFHGSHHEVIGDRAIRVTWRFAGGALDFLAVLGGETLAVPENFTGEWIWSTGCEPGARSMSGWAAIMAKSGGDAA